MAASKFTGMVIGLMVTFIIIAALYPTLATALADYDTAVGDGLSAALVVVVPILVSVAILWYALREAGFGSKGGK